jgi:hypothetical protein
MIHPEVYMDMISRIAAILTCESTGTANEVIARCKDIIRHNDPNDPEDAVVNDYIRATIRLAEYTIEDARNSYHRKFGAGVRSATLRAQGVRSADTLRKR